MKTFQFNNAETVATLANGAQLAAAIAARVISGQASQKFNGMDLEENQIINLTQSVFQSELLKKVGSL